MVTAAAKKKRFSVTFVLKIYHLVTIKLAPGSWLWKWIKALCMIIDVTNRFYCLSAMNASTIFTQSFCAVGRKQWKEKEEYVLTARQASCVHINYSAFWSANYHIPLIASEYHLHNHHEICVIRQNLNMEKIDF